MNALRPGSGPGKEPNEEDAFLTTLAQPTSVNFSCYKMVKCLLYAAKYIQIDVTFPWQVSNETSAYG